MSVKNDGPEPVLVQVVLLVLLVGLGTVLYSRANGSSLLKTQASIDSNKRLAYVGATAIEVSDVPIQPLELEELGVLAFLLRASTLDRDLELWTSVQRKLPSAAIVGYCDSQPCIEDVKARKGSIPFRVVALASAIDLQALMNADADGAFIAKNRSGANGVIQWRTNHVSADNITAAALGILK